MSLDIADPQAIEQIAALLGAQAEDAPFAVRGEPVHRITMFSEEHQEELLITLWPSERRVDVRLGKSYWVLKDISQVELYPGVEALFRREQPTALLFVSVKGRVALVA